MGYGITALGSGITDRGIGISSFFRDQGSGCTIFLGSGMKTGHTFGTKDQKFAYKNGIIDEKNTSLPWTFHRSPIQVTVLLINKQAKQCPPALNQSKTSPSMPVDTVQCVYMSATQRPVERLTCKNTSSGLIPLLKGDH